MMDGALKHQLIIKGIEQSHQIVHNLAKYKKVVHFTHFEQKKHSH